MNKRNKIVAQGWNQPKSHTLSNSYNKHRHAEFDAIMKSRENLRNCSIYVYRETKDGSLGNSRPCIYCLELLRKYGINKMYFTSEHGYEMESL